jgi:hypothetical protein
VHPRGLVNIAGTCPERARLGNRIGAHFTCSCEHLIHARQMHQTGNGSKDRLWLSLVRRHHAWQGRVQMKCQFRVFYRSWRFKDLEKLDAITKSELVHFHHRPW